MTTPLSSPSSIPSSEDLDETPPAPASGATRRLRRPHVVALAAGLTVVVVLAVLLGTRLVRGSGDGANATRSGVSADPGWSLLWGDGFDGRGRLSRDWLYRTGNSVPGGPPAYGTDEVESNTDSTSNIFQADGKLHIRATRNAAGAWTSGRVESVRQDLRPPKGGVLAVEARIQLPDVTGEAAKGYWPAFWLLGAPFRSNPWSWPGVGEIDIMENVNGTDSVFGTAHCGTAPGGDCNEKNGLAGNTGGGSPTLQQAMHTYRVEWDESVTPHQIRWYLDGREYHQVTQSQMSPQTWSNAFGHGFYLILNLAVGGQFPAALGGGPTPQTAPGGTLLIDYVKAETRGGTPRG